MPQGHSRELHHPSLADTRLTSSIEDPE